MLLMLLSSMDWQKPVLSSNMNDYSSIQTYRMLLLCWATSLCWIFNISIFSLLFICSWIWGGSKLNIALTKVQSYSTSLSPGLGNVYESAEWKQHKKVLSKWPLWPNPCRAPAVFELFAWPRYERGLCWTVEPGDTGACVCTCWCVCALDVFMDTGWEMWGRGAVETG